jgi:hypothetical protein
LWKNGDSLVNNIDQNKLSISLLTIGLIWIGFLYFLTDFDLYSSTLGQATVIENYKPTDQNFEKIQTNNSELLSNIYYQIEVGNIILPIMISSYGNPILNLNFDNEEKSIMLVISPLNAVDNKLLIDIPRTILDSKANGNDKNFTVMVDGLPAKFLEITNSSGDKIYSNSIIDNVSAIQYSNNTDSRLLMIEFNSNSKIIKITGTDTSNLDKENISTFIEKSQFYVPVLINSNTDYLPLQLMGGILNNTQLVINSQDNRTFFLSIVPYSDDGKLLIDIPRTILDSKANGNDKNFTVMVDGLPAKFLEITNSSGDKIYSNSIIDNVSAIQYSNNTDSRLLMIEFNSNSKIIKITGTDTSNLDKKSQINDSRTDHTSSEDKSQYNIYVPIISIAVAFGIIVFYFLYRNNKLRFMKKLRS